MRKLVGITALLAGLALLFSAGAMPAYADPGNGTDNANAHGRNANANASGGSSNSGGSANAGGSANGGSANGGTSQADDPNGANGTVKIHDWPEHKNGAEMANDPKVCQFEIHGFNFDSGQTGRWWIQEHKWGNGDSSKVVLSGTYTTDANGDWTNRAHTLPDGHYKLFVEMTHAAGNSGNTVVTYKMKVFKVECESTTTGTTTGSSTGESTGTTTGTTTGNSTGTVGGNGTGNANGSSAGTPANTVAGFESVPTGAAIIGTGPEVPAGVSLDDSQGTNGVNGTESAPMAAAGSESAPESALAALGSLPATSTGTAGLGLAGLAITGLGFALLRRQPK